MVSIGRREAIIGISSALVVYTEIGTDLDTIFPKMKNVPDETSLQVTEMWIDVEQITDRGIGHGYAAVKVKNTETYPIQFTIKLRLLENGAQFSYDYQHRKLQTVLQPNEEKTVVEQWRLGEFPESVNATSATIETFTYKNANRTIEGIQNDDAEPYYSRE